MNHTTPSFFRLAAPLFLDIFIDGMGLGLLFPIMNTLFVDPHSGFISAPLSLSMRHFLFGLTVSIFMLCWFFGAAYLGDLSDAIGRRKSSIHYFLFNDSGLEQLLLFYLAISC